MRRNAADWSRVRWAGLAVPIFWAAAVPTMAQESGVTSRVFNRHAGSVVEVHAVDTLSAAKTSRGTGFFVTAHRLVTNYHVVSPVVLEPRLHELQVVRGDTTHAASLVGIDAVHDLAIVEIAESWPHALTVREASAVRGQQVFALGYPGDLGITIVNGTFNGVLEHTLYPRTHFTGSLNSGMSGGPTLAADGRLVGVNVATAGNALSFLVPASRVIDLLALVAAEDYEPPDDFVAVLRDQVDRHQDAYLTNLLAAPFPTVQLGAFAVPTRPAEFFDCWGDTSEDDDRFRFLDHQCSTEDVIFISDTYNGGVVQLFHRVIEAPTVNRFRFYRTFSEHFRVEAFWSRGTEEDVTSYACREGKVAIEGGVLVTVVCARRLRRLPGLYDVVVRAAAVGQMHTGLETTLQLTAVGFDNAIALARRFLESIRWNQ